jgi:hypothetical protein
MRAAGLNKSQGGIDQLLVFGMPGLLFGEFHQIGDVQHIL